MLRKLVVSTLIVMMIVGFVPHGLAAKFNPGNTVEVINQLPGGHLLVRESPGGANTIGLGKTNGERGMILSGPSAHTLPGGGTVYNWWQIRWNDGVEGWSAEGNPGVEDYLISVYISPSTNFRIDDPVKVVGTQGLGLIVRSDPPFLTDTGINEFDGAVGTVVGGPFYGTCTGAMAGFYHFWKVNFGSAIGWCAQNWLTISQWTLTIYSAHDNPSPSNGAHYYSSAQSVTCSVTSPVTEGGITYTCSGWSGTGSVPSIGSSTSVTFTITQDSSITWNWPPPIVHHTLTVSSAHDSPNPSNGQHTYNDGDWVTCSVASSVNEGGTTWNCIGWSGTGSVPTIGSVNTVTFQIYESSSITWNWVVTPGNQPPTCVIKLQKNGIEISQIDVGESFSVDVSGSSDDLGIAQVRFSSDDLWNGIPEGQWTQWFSWTSSSGGWDASTRIVHWTFSTPGIKEVWAEVKDNAGSSSQKHSAINARKWTFAVITDPHIGRGWHDFGTPDYDDNLGTTEQVNCLTDRLVDTVTWINQNYETENIRFLVTLGDISDSGEKSELTRAKNILDDLIIPYFPCIGNHDVWSKIEELKDGKWKETDAYLNSGLYFSQVFDDAFFSQQFDKLGVDWMDKPSSPIIHLQNYAFGYRGTDFIFADYVDRTSSCGGGIYAYPFIQTMSFVEGEMSARAEQSVIVFSHYPFTTFGLGGAGHYSGTIKGHLGRVAQIYGKNLLTFGGHVHWYDNRNFQQVQNAYYRQANGGFLYADYYEQAKVKDPRYDWAQVSITSIWTKGMMGGLGDDSKDFLRLVDGIHADQSEIKLLGWTDSIPDTADPDDVILDPNYPGLDIKINSWSLGSPGELRVYDSQGRITGCVNGTSVEQIPNSTYDDEYKMVIICPSNDTYFSQIVGTDIGTYGLSEVNVTGGDLAVFNAYDIPISVGAIHQFTVNWTALSQAERGITVRVDSNRDGVFEYTFASDSELTQSEFLSAIGSVPTPANVYVYPKELVDPALIIGSSFALEVNIANASDVYSFAFRLSFSPNVIQAQFITKGGFLENAGGTTVTFSEIDNTVGFVIFGVTLNAPPAVSGNGKLATIGFRVVNNGSSVLVLSNVILKDANGASLTYTTTNGRFSNKARVKGDVNGDGVIDLLDLVYAAMCFGSTSSDVRWNPAADVNNDGIIDIIDLVIIILHWAT